MAKKVSKKVASVTKKAAKKTAMKKASRRVSPRRAAPAPSGFGNWISNNKFPLIACAATLTGVNVLGYASFIDNRGEQIFPNYAVSESYELDDNRVLYTEGVGIMNEKNVWVFIDEGVKYVLIDSDNLENIDFKSDIEPNYDNIVLNEIRVEKNRKSIIYHRDQIDDDDFVKQVFEKGDNAARFYAKGAREKLREGYLDKLGSTLEGLTTPDYATPPAATTPVTPAGPGAVTETGSFQTLLEFLFSTPSSPSS